MPSLLYHSVTILTVHCVNVLYLNKDNMYTLPVQCVTHHVLCDLLLLTLASDMMYDGLYGDHCA